MLAWPGKTKRCVVPCRVHAALLELCSLAGGARAGRLAFRAPQPIKLELSSCAQRPSALQQHTHCTCDATKTCDPGVDVPRVHHRCAAAHQIRCPHIQFAQDIHTFNLLIHPGVDVPRVHRQRAAAHQGPGLHRDPAHGNPGGRRGLTCDPRSFSHNNATAQAHQLTSNHTLSFCQPLTHTSYSGARLLCVVWLPRDQPLWRQQPQRHARGPQGALKFACRQCV